MMGDSCEDVTLRGGGLPVEGENDPTHLLHCHDCARLDVLGQEARAVCSRAYHLALDPVLCLKVLPDLSSISFRLVNLHGGGRGMDEGGGAAEETLF